LTWWRALGFEPIQANPVLDTRLFCQIYHWLGRQQRQVEPKYPEWDNRLGRTYPL